MIETKTSFGYMPLYVADYDADTEHLTTLEHGAYFLLIKAYWKTGGALSSSDSRLANICRLSIDEWRNVKTTVAEFFLIENGLWTHKRVEIELEKFRAKSAQAAAARKVGIEKAKAARKAAKEAQEGAFFSESQSTDVQRTFNGRSTIGGRSTDVTIKNHSELNNTNGISKTINVRSTVVQRTFNDADADSINTTEYYGSIEVLPMTENIENQHQSIEQAFRQVVGRSMRKIDVECLARVSKIYSDQEIEAGIYIAGIRANGLGKKPGSLAYFESEMEKTKAAGIQDLAQYIGHLKKKLSKAQANGAHA